MLNRISRRTYGLACLAIFVAIVLAGCPAAPGSVKPTVSKKVDDIASLAVGATTTVNIRDVFKGEKLTYSVRSSDLSIAAATIANNNQSVAILAIGPGTATITVTATNSGGSVSQAFQVTVPTPQSPPPQQPPPQPQPPQQEPPDETPTTTDHSDCPERIEITRGGRKTCTLTENHSLAYTGSMIRVSGPPGGAETNVWTITALLKGRPVVQIREDETGNTVDEITVVVPNTAPRRLPAVSLADVTLTANNADASENAGLHIGTIAGIKSAFEDDDTADTAFNYKVQHKPDELLIKTTKGFMLPQNNVATDITGHEFVVLKPFGEPFEVEVYAYDQDNARSDQTVTVTFIATTPAVGSYTAKQRDNGTFEDVRLGNRLDTNHTLTFSDALKIATDLNTKLTVADSSERVYLSSVSGADSNSDNGVCASNKVPTSLGLGTYCYTYTSGRRIAVTPPTLALTAPTITFQLPSKENKLTGGSDSITFQYFVGAYSQAKTSSDRDTANDPQTVHRSATARVTLRIHKCTDTADCPINSNP